MRSGVLWRGTWPPIEISFPRKRESRLDPRLRGGDRRERATSITTSFPRKRESRLGPRLRGGDGREWGDFHHDVIPAEAGIQTGPPHWAGIAEQGCLQRRFSRMVNPHGIAFLGPRLPSGMRSAIRGGDGRERGDRLVREPLSDWLGGRPLGDLDRFAVLRLIGDGPRARRCSAEEAQAVRRGTARLSAVQPSRIDA